MTNPYAVNGGAPSGDGNYEKHPKWIAKEVGDSIQGVILDQSPWLPNKYKQGETYRVLSIKTNEGTYSVWVNSYYSKRAVGDAIDAAKLTDTAPGQIFGMQLTELKPTDKGNPAKVFKAVVAPAA